MKHISFIGVSSQCRNAVAVEYDTGQSFPVSCMQASVTSAVVNEWLIHIVVHPHKPSVSSEVLAVRTQKCVYNA